VRRPPLIVVLVAIFVIALGETAGAAMSLLRPQLTRYARARVAANPTAHGLANSAEYDSEITARAVFTAEAGISFFHTHAEGLGPVVLFAGTVAATVVQRRLGRRLVHGLLTIGGLFPLGYLAYSVTALELGREPGVELAEGYILTPLGCAVIVALVMLAVLMLVGRRAATSS
jgi:hypothetical protein